MGHDGTGNLSNVVGFGLGFPGSQPPHALPTPAGAQERHGGGGGDSIATEAFGYEHLTMVMDRGKVSEVNPEVVTRTGYAQLRIVREWNKEAWSYIMRWPREELEQPRFVMERARASAAYYRSWVATLYGMKRMRVAVVEIPRRVTEEREARDLAVMTLETGHPSARRLRQILKVLGRDVAEKNRGQRGLVVNKQVQKEEERGLGWFLLFSTELSLGAEEMFALYFQRDAIKKVFEPMKGGNSPTDRSGIDGRIGGRPTRRWCIWPICCGAGRSGS